MNDKTKKNAFTLVELLAVIVILAIILVIAVPKVMSIIEDAKKGTLESSAKMIASEAEKQKVQNTLLGNNKTITCEDVVNINDVDYDYCGIEFKNDNALVTIAGDGKFEGLYVCEGNKTNAISSNETCNVEYGNGAMYINKLQAFKGSDNGLIIDTTADKNIRYVGSNPSNKIYFNCKDVDSNNISYGEEKYDYANSCEIWRIIGVFDVDNGSGNIESRVKIVRNDIFTINMSFDSSADNVNSGNGIDYWGESTYEDGTYYEGSDLMRLLNGYYLGKSNTCKYCNSFSQGTCENDCSSKVSSISNISLLMIENAVWKIGGTSWENIISASKMYNNERNFIGKLCNADSKYNGISMCTDTVNRTIDWIGKIGLVYPSDYGYASTDSSCASDISGEDSTCEKNNWLHSNSSYWTFSPNSYVEHATSLWSVSFEYNLMSRVACDLGGVRPSLYLSSNIQIIGGDGNTIPYKISM